MSEITKTEQERRMEFARQEAARAWCTAKTSSKVMDPDLAEAFAEILAAHLCDPPLGCATTEALLRELHARVG